MLIIESSSIVSYYRRSCSFWLGTEKLTSESLCSLSLSYGSTITTEKNRAATLLRYDGVETLAQILGTALSPFLFDWLGFLGSYLARATFTLAALLYLVFVIREPLQKSEVPSHTN